jgi:hypothetical protein
MINGLKSFDHLNALAPRTVLMMIILSTRAFKNPSLDHIIK